MELILTGMDSVLVIIAGHSPWRSSFGPLAFHAIRSTDGGIIWHDTTTLYGRGVPSWGGVTTIGDHIFISHADTRISLIHFSTDGGVSWDSSMSEGLPTGFPGRLISKGSLLFLALDNYALENSLFRSTGYGESWEPVWADSSGGYFEQLLVVGNTLFATMSDYGGGNLRAMISTDEGQTWSTRPYQPGRMWSHAEVLFRNASYSNGGPLVSTDLGLSWNQWNDGLPRDSTFFPPGEVYTMTRTALHTLYLIIHGCQKCGFDHCRNW